MTSDSDVVIGIDLGTTNSLAAMVNKRGTVTIFKNDGDYLTPSSVWFSQDTADVLVGKEAVKKKARDPKNVICDVKRLLGMSYDDKNVITFREEVPFKMDKVGGKPLIVVTYNGENLLERPLDISARVLKALVESAEKTLRGRSDRDLLKIKSAVITVPAYFQQAQKSETLEAAKLAGITDVYLITEPTAAAFGYGFEEQRYDGYRVLVFDFGGGTFDVSVLQVKNGRFDTLGTRGDLHLGGRDLDVLLRKHCAEEIKKRWGKDCMASPIIKQLLLEKCEDLKKTLSKRGEESIYMGDCFGSDSDITLYVSRETFEKLAMPKFMRAMDIVKLALRGAKLTSSEIDEVLMVGGTSRIPMLSNLLISEVGFTKGQLNRSLNEDEAVAYGAAVYAAKIAGTLKTSIPISIADIIPLSLGILTNEDSFCVLIGRQTKIPCNFTQNFFTRKNDQYSMSFKVFEGERKLASKNNQLGSFIFEGLSLGMARTASVSLTFEIDRNGILHVTATHAGKTKTMDMNYEIRSGNEPDVEEALRAAEQHCQTDTKEKERGEAESNLRIEIEQAKYKCTNVAILELCKRYETWLKSNPHAAKEIYKDKQHSFKAELDAEKRSSMISIREDNHGYRSW